MTEFGLNSISYSQISRDGTNVDMEPFLNDLDLAFTPAVEWDLSRIPWNAEEGENILNYLFFYVHRDFFRDIKWARKMRAV